MFRKLGLWLVGVAAIAALGGSGAALPASAFTGNWNQFGHDQSRRSATDALAPTWPSLVPGFPVSCGGCAFGPVVSEVKVPGEQAPRQAIFFTGNRTIYGYGSDGRSLPGNWPSVLGPHTLGGNLGFPAVSKEGDRTKIFAASQGDDDFGAELWSTLYAVGGDGRPLGGRWPWTVSEPGAQIFSFPTLVGGPERSPATVYFAHHADGWQDGFLNALGTDGVPQPGWPQSVETSWFMMGPAAADDGSTYIAGGDFEDWDGLELYGFAADGTRKPGWPVRLGGPWSGATESGPAVANDGTVYVGADVEPPLMEGPSRLHAFYPDGRPKPGFPVELPEPIFSVPSIADDGTVYVVTGTCCPQGGSTTAVYAIGESGQIKSGWPLRYEAPPIGQIVIDGADRVFFSSGNKIYGYSPAGKPLRGGWPYRAPDATGFGALALADDGTLYAVAGHRDGDYLYALVDGEPSLPKKEPTRLPARHKIDDFTATPGAEPPMPQWLRR